MMQHKSWMIPLAIAKIVAVKLLSSRATTKLTPLGRRGYGVIVIEPPFLKCNIQKVTKIRFRSISRMSTPQFLSQQYSVLMHHFSHSIAGFVCKASSIAAST
jgi:hypothetical protein